MGLLIKGQWHDHWYSTKDHQGHFVRPDAQFRHWITPDGTAGRSGIAGYKAEKDRYHLYISRACPWAHRTTIFRSIKGLEEMISLSVVHWHMAEHGWTFAAGAGVIPDPVINAHYLHDIYTQDNPEYSGRVTVPLLWDKKTGSIVSNESSEIIRMFNSAFDPIGANAADYYPPALQDEIDALNERIYRTINNGVYRAGFATTQQAYEQAVTALFESMDWLEQRLSTRRYLTGKQITEADWRLFTTLLRFDPVYVGHFKCNQQRLVDYPHLWAYTRDLYQQPGIEETVAMDHIKKHYYVSQTTINPTGIVPLGPDIDFSAHP